MLNVLAFAVMIGLGVWCGLTASYHLLLIFGVALATLAGFASFSQGSLFSRGRGDVVSCMCILGDVGLAVTIGWLHGLWWGLAAVILFWPVMYRLGARILFWIPQP